jgi:hypothetical protein
LRSPVKRVVKRRPTAAAIAGTCCDKNAGSRWSRCMNARRSLPKVFIVSET